MSSSSASSSSASPLQKVGKSVPAARPPADGRKGCRRSWCPITVAAGYPTANAAGAIRDEDPRAFYTVAGGNFVLRSADGQFDAVARQEMDHYIFSHGTAVTLIDGTQTVSTRLLLEVVGYFGYMPYVRGTGSVFDMCVEQLSRAVFEYIHENGCVPQEVDVLGYERSADCLHSVHRVIERVAIRDLFLSGGVVGDGEGKVGCRFDIRAKRPLRTYYLKMPEESQRLLRKKRSAPLRE